MGSNVDFMLSRVGWASNICRGNFHRGSLNISDGIMKLFKAHNTRLSFSHISFELSASLDFECKFVCI